MWSIAHIVFCYLHFVPGQNGGWTESRSFPRYTTEERASIALPFEGYWEKVS